MDLNKPHFKLHPDDEGVDRIEIQVVPRFKTSGLSGDEWRRSARIRVYRKGQLVGEDFTGSMEGAAQKLPWLWLTLPEWTEGPLYDGARGGACQQPGCSDVAVVTYQIKQEYSARGEGPLPPSPLGPPRRRFCEVHAIRGDCGLEDADQNYELVSGPPPERSNIPPEAVSPARRMDIRAASIDDVPGAVQRAVDDLRKEKGR